MKRKSNETLAKELARIPKSTAPRKVEPKTNRRCCCGKKLGEDDTYYIRIEPGEDPEMLCENCTAELS